MKNSLTKPQRGRPRDPAIDVRMLEAALRELAHKGFSGMSVEAVARVFRERTGADEFGFTTCNDGITFTQDGPNGDWSTGPKSSAVVC